MLSSVRVRVVSRPPCCWPGRVCQSPSSNASLRWVDAEDDPGARRQTDRPPGINTVFITKLAAARSQFMSAETAQGSKQAAATGAREARKQLVESIKDRRIEIQFAADAAWPPGQPGHGAIRREFGLPPDRFLSSRRRAA